MSVKIVTDSTCDLPKGMADELGITVVPLNVQFGTDSFQDGVDLSADEFYRRLLERSVWPKTSAPAPGAFKEYYERLANADGIVSLHISSKLSGTYNAAVAGKNAANLKCRVEVIDTYSVSMGLGLLTIAAAKAARSGATIDGIVKMVRDSASEVWMVGALDNLEFLQKGGRIGRASAWLGALLAIKPIISLHEGEVVPMDRVRTRSKAIERLHEVLGQRLPAKGVSVMYSTDPAPADQLVERIKRIYPEQEIYASRFGSVLGSYVGPGCLAAFTLK